MLCTLQKHKKISLWHLIWGWPIVLYAFLVFGLFAFAAMLQCTDVCVFHSHFSSFFPTPQKEVFASHQRMMDPLCCLVGGFKCFCWTPAGAVDKVKVKENDEKEVEVWLPVVVLCLETHHRLELFFAKGKSIAKWCSKRTFDSAIAECCTVIGTWPLVLKGSLSAWKNVSVIHFCLCDTRLWRLLCCDFYFQGSSFSLKLAFQLEVWDWG